MRIERADPVPAKDWYIGRRNSTLDTSAHSHFAFQLPGLEGKGARTDKVSEPRSRLEQ